MGQGVIADGMRIEWDVPITMDDGVVLRADIFRPIKDGHYPAILTYGAYGKGVSFQEGFKSAWDKMVRDYPETTRGTTGKYQVFELCDPERWVPDDYAIVRVDSRGSGRSPGFMDLKSIRETKDIY
ncbi:MAG: CocE/NonD family hydrolase, partial [Bradyrhizobium sp.]